MGTYVRCTTLAKASLARGEIDVSPISLKVSVHTWGARTLWLLVHFLIPENCEAKQSLAVQWSTVTCLVSFATVIVETSENKYDRTTLKGAMILGISKEANSIWSMVPVESLVTLCDRGFAHFKNLNRGFVRILIQTFRSSTTIFYHFFFLKNVN